MPRPSLCRAPAAALPVAIALLLATALPALSLDQPLRLRDAVTDQAGVLDPAEEAAVADALGRLRDEHGIQLFVALVDTTGDRTATEFTKATADASSMGGNDALLLVAVDDRSDALWVGPSLDGVTDAEIDAILSGTVEPRLAKGDFADAVVAGATALGDAATGSVVETTAPTVAPPVATPAAGASEPASQGGFNLAGILAVLLVVGGLLLVGGAMWSRRRAARAAAASLDALGRDANRALLHADEALKDAANDVEFAAAQWGDAEVVPYREAIARANDELRAAFSVRQRLDDAEPETPQQRDQLLREILARTASVQQQLDAQEQRFDQLRDLEAVAPAQLAALPAAIQVQQDRRSAAEATIARLRSAYAPSAVESAAGNVTEAGKALATAAAEAGRGQAVVGTKPSEGVVALRRAQEGLARATQLVEAVERLAASLDGAAARLPAELAAAAADLETARASVASAATSSATSAPPPAPAAGQPETASPASMAAALHAAEAAFAEARRAADARPLDPLAALQRATAANQAADAVVASVQAAASLWQRRTQVAASAVATAEGHLSRATDFITTRRHGVGREARTRAAEAMVRLDEARGLVDVDPERAVASANRATQLADEAYRLAAAEFDGWNSGSGPVAGPYRGGSPAGGEIAGAVIGAVIGSILSGGGPAGRGSGWGGSPWGGPGGGGQHGGFGLPTGGGSGGLRIPSGGIKLPSGGGGRVRGGRW